MVAVVGLVVVWSWLLSCAVAVDLAMVVVAVVVMVVVPAVAAAFAVVVAIIVNDDIVASQTFLQSVSPSLKECSAL